MRFLLALLLVSALTTVSCKSSNKSDKPRIYDSQFPEVSLDALHIAEEKGGMKLKNPGSNPIGVKWYEGDTISPCGWKGWKREGGIEGGNIDALRNIKLALTDGRPWVGDWHCRPDVHEMQHAIYRSHGIPSARHHKMMAEKGYRVK